MIVFKVFIEFVTVLLFCSGLFGPKAGDVSSPTGIETVLPALEGKVLTAGPPGTSLNLRFVSHFVNHYCLVTKLCLTLCDPMDCSPPGSFHPWDSPGKKSHEFNLISV